MLGLLLQGCQLLVAVADVVELLLEVLSDFYQGIDVLYMELLLQRVDGVEPAVDLVESCRFEVDAVDVGAYLLSDVLQFDVAAVEPFGSLCYGGPFRAASGWYCAAFWRLRALCRAARARRWPSLKMAACSARSAAARWSG